MKKILAWLNQAGNAKFGKLSLRDIIHGIFMAAITAVGVQLYQSIVNHSQLTLHSLLTTAEAAALPMVSYYLKQILSNTDGTFGPEKK